MADRQVRINIDVSGDAALQITKVNSSLGQMQSQTGRTTSALNMFKGALGAVGFAVTAKAGIDLVSMLKDQGMEWVNARAAVEATTGSLAAANAAIRDAQDATDGLVNRTNSAIAVNTFFRNGLASTGAEAGRMALTGQILSQVYEAQGASFEKYIRFIVSGNTALLDNFNLTQQMIDERSKEIQSTEGLSKAEADRQARIELLNEAADEYIQTLPEAARATAEYEAAASNLSATLGETLLPVWTSVIELANRGIQGFQQAGNAIQAVSDDAIQSTSTYEEYVKQMNDASKKAGLLGVAIQPLIESAYEQRKATLEAAAATNDLNDAVDETTHVYDALAPSEVAANRRRKEHLDTLRALEKQETDASAAALNASAEHEKAMERAQEAASRHVDALNRVNERQSALELSHSRRLADIRADMEGVADRGIEENRKKLHEQLEALEESHNTRLASLKGQQRDEDRSYRNRKAELERDLYDRLETLAKDHAQRVINLQRDVANATQEYQRSITSSQSDYNDRMTDMEEDHASAKQRLEYELAGTADTTRRNELERRIRYEEEEYQIAVRRMQREQEQEEANLAQQRDIAITALQQRMADEDVEYAAAQVKAQERNAQDVEDARIQHQIKLQQLKDRIAAENETYSKQQAALKKQADEDLANIRANNAQRLAELQLMLSREQEDYGIANSRLAADRANENAEIKKYQTEAQAEYQQTREYMINVANGNKSIATSAKNAADQSIPHIRAMTAEYNKLAAAARSVSGAGASYTRSPGRSIAGYQHGTDYVPQTGLALLHQGEAVIPASQNAGSASKTINVYIEYAPAVSLGNRYEAETVLAPMIANALSRRM